MDRLTGKDAQLMMEALANVYEKKGDCVDKDKKTKHNCAKKVCSEQWGEGTCVPEHHTLLEDGTVTHYDVVFEHGLERMVPVEELEVLVTEMHEHAAMEGEELQENQAANRARQRELRQKQNAGRAEQQFGALKPKPRTGSFQDRRFARRSSSAAAQANTNKVGQNIKVGSPTGPAQNDQLKKPADTAPAPTTSMANKAPVPTASTTPKLSIADRLKMIRDMRARSQSRIAAQGGTPATPAVNTTPKTAPPSPTSGPGGYKVSAGATPKLGGSIPLSQKAKMQDLSKKDTGSFFDGAKGGKYDTSAKPAAAAPAPVVKKKPAMGARNRMRMEEIDIFDTIKEYLIGEGATEEEALKQMLTLTDEQRTEIIEGSCGSKSKKKKSEKGGYGK